MKVGAAVSLELSLCTRRYHGFEKFVTHWTPLKGEKGKVHFVVLALGAMSVICTGFKGGKALMWLPLYSRLGNNYRVGW
jgi:hypothetical protein